MKNRIVLIILLVGILFTSCLTDLRTKEDILFLTQKNVSNIDNPRVLLEEASRKHGLERWKELSTISVSVQDTFMGFIGKQASPFKEISVNFNLSFIPGKYTGQLNIQSGKESGKTWGIVDGETYKIEKDKEAYYRKSKKTKFWIPTYQYFVELPFRILEADTLVYLGLADRNNKKYKRVLASWKTVEPQKDIDQYVVWINDQLMIDFVEFTVRDEYGFIKGAASYLGFDDFENIMLPSSIQIFGNVTGKNVLHQMQFDHYEFDAVDKSLLEDPR